LFDGSFNRRKKTYNAIPVQVDELPKFPLVPAVVFFIVRLSVIEVLNRIILW
jgi:hypothetical protein